MVNSGGGAIDGGAGNRLPTLRRQRTSIVEKYVAVMSRQREQGKTESGYKKRLLSYMRDGIGRLTGNMMHSRQGRTRVNTRSY